MDNYVKIQLPLEVHFIVSFIYCQVPLNLLKTDEFNQHIFVFLLIFNIGLGRARSRPARTSKHSAVVDQDCVSAG